MADLHWLGGTSGNFGTAANYAEAAAPADGDNVYFMSGSVNVDAGLDQHGVTLNSLKRGPGYTGTIGVSTGSPLIIGATMIYLRGGSASAKTFIKAGDDPIGSIEVAPVDPAAAVSLAGGTGGIAAMFASRGTISMESGTTTEANVDADNGVGSANTGLTFTINGATVTTLNQISGVSVLASGTLSNANIDKGTLTINGGTLTNATARATGSIVINSNGNITSLRGFGKGTTIDASSEMRPFTVASVKLSAGAVCKPGIAMTVTSGILTPAGLPLLSITAGDRRA